MTNFGQKFTIEKHERNMHRIFKKNQKTVKCSKLGEKNCGKRYEMSEGKRTRARAKYCQFQNTISFDLRQNLTCRLKLWDDTEQILQYMNLTTTEIEERIQPDYEKRLGFETH